MAYRLKPGGNVSGNLVQIAVRELESAREAIEASVEAAKREEAVHEARKSLKKVRAICRVMQPLLTAEQFRAENSRLRDIGRSLADLRDAAALAGTLEQLKRLPARQRPPRAACEQVARFLAERGRAMEDQYTNGGGRVLILQAVGGAAQRWQAWSPPHEDISLVVGGLGRNTKRLRRAYEIAYQTADTANFHELRKRVKDRWYMFRLLKAVWPSVLDGYVATLATVETQLGDDHNLAVLDSVIQQEQRFDPELQQDLSRMIVARQKALRREAKPALDLLLAERPKPLGRRLTRYWALWVEGKTKDSSHSAAA